MVIRQFTRVCQK